MVFVLAEVKGLLLCGRGWCRLGASVVAQQSGACNVRSWHVNQAEKLLHRQEHPKSMRLPVEQVGDV